MTAPHAWTLGAILDEQELDEGTCLLVVRPDAAQAACRELERRLLELRLSGYLTLILDLAGAERVSGAMLATLLRVQRRIGVRNGRLLVGAESADVAHVLECTGLEALDLPIGAA